jgi:DNA-binding MarR family transcriptional regulator
MTSPVSTLVLTLALKMRSRAEKFALRPDLTVAQSRAIGFLERSEAMQHRGVIQRELAEVLRISAASVSSLIDGLEKNGYVERRSSAEDVRRKELHLLPKAKGLAGDFDRQMEQAEKELLSPLTPDEQATLLELLQRIDRSFDPQISPRGPQNF